jgi:hypothetical protein
LFNQKHKYYQQYQQQKNKHINKLQQQKLASSSLFPLNNQQHSLASHNQKKKTNVIFILTFNLYFKFNFI